MRRSALALVLLLGGAAPGFADAASETLDACVHEQLATNYSTAKVEAACVGLVSQPCLDAKPNGGTTIEIMQCLASEQAAWDVLLNANWKTLRADAKSMEADGADGAAATLLAAQRAWLDYRQNECSFAAAMFTGGSIAGIVANECMQDLTARRTIEIITHVDMGH